MLHESAARTLDAVAKFSSRYPTESRLLNALAEEAAERIAMIQELLETHSTE